ncbi:MAG TPA: glycosyltransferase family 4 protein [Candidatus Paceibacterota bacterium]|nr:glycosyltransferase family 4 protein [Verrucomicrobiota bacterium]HRY50513.1 glycosyltransferase family 4 protein [Candidatus Paceibacterota bacterium]
MATSSSRPLQLAFLTHEPFYPPSGGGSAEAVYLVKELVRRGHQVHLFAPASDPEAEIEERFAIHCHPFRLWTMGRYADWRNFKYLLYPFFLQRLVERAARTIRLDLILSQHSISAVAAGRLKRSLGRPVVMNFLDYLTAFMETWPRYLAPPRLLAVLKRFELSMPNRYQADGVMTVSEVLAGLFANTGYPRDRMLPIHFGYDDAVFVRDNGPAPSGYEPVVVMHGSLDRHHLGPIAREAVAFVVRQRPEVVFRFVGQETAALRQFRAALRHSVPQARIDCTGFVPYSEVARYLSAASVGWIPYEESMGVHCAFVAKAVEYLGMGLPVASTALRALMQYFRDDPMIRFVGFDGRSLGETIMSWLKEPIELRQRLAVSASARVKRELTWDAVCRRAVDFVEHTSRHPLS